MHPILRLFTALGLALVAALPAHAEEINVAVAANFLGTLQKLAPMFERAHGHHIIPSAGSSGQLYTQIKQGAPFDVLLSADSERPRQLEEEGLAVPGSRFTYAIGTLVLWSAEAGRIDREGKALQAGHYRFIAIADPRTAPYGSAARQVLAALGLWDGLKRDRKIIVGENINQTWQFESTGNVDMAFVAMSQVVDGDSISGSYWIPPQSLYKRLDQDAVMLTRTSKRAAASAFLDWLHTSPEALAGLKAAGYRPAE